MKHPDPLVIGIAGGSGSGKTTVAQEILQRVGPDRIAFLQHDSYYKDLSGLPPAQRAEVNFDHPNSLETDLLISHIAALRFIRRLQRDISERGRTTESVIRQYQLTVRPMHMEFVEPSKRYADVIIPEGGFNAAALDMVVARDRKSVV